MAEEFDKVAKKRFNGSGDSYVKFSNLTTVSEIEYGIRNGQVKLTK